MDVQSNHNHTHSNHVNDVEGMNNVSELHPAVNAYLLKLFLNRTKGVKQIAESKSKKL